MVMRLMGTDTDTRGHTRFIFTMKRNQMQHLLAAVATVRRNTAHVPATELLHESLRNITYEISHALETDRVSDPGT
jgi:hypothetical protein